MKNREWLMNTAAVDVLCEMNNRLANVCKPICGNAPCIMHCFMEGKDVCKRCENFRFCRDCIAAWLNEERQ